LGVFAISVALGASPIGIVVLGGTAGEPVAVRARPTYITQGASHSLFALRWRTWGGKIATAAGNVDTGAGAANTQVFRVSVQAFGAGVCRGRRVYTALRVGLPSDAYVETLVGAGGTYDGGNYVPVPASSRRHCPSGADLRPGGAREAIAAAQAASPGLSKGFAVTAVPALSSRTLETPYLQACGPAVADLTWLVDAHPVGQTCHACDAHEYLARRRNGRWKQLGWFAY
jgi:hypothetical protein